MNNIILLPRKQSYVKFAMNVGLIHADRTLNNRTDLAKKESDASVARRFLGEIHMPDYRHPVASLKLGLISQSFGEFHLGPHTGLTNALDDKIQEDFKIACDYFQIAAGMPDYDGDRSPERALQHIDYLRTRYGITAG